jgi:enoyl-CoA hydratase/carnithine racemase
MLRGIDEQSAVFEEILYSVAGGVATITLNRPERRNALSMRGYDELVAALRRAEADETAGIVVIAGAGRSWCAGGDIEMAQTMLTSEAAARTHFFGRMIEASHWMLLIGKPVVCAIQGACIGGGAELMTFADFVIADASAFFAYNGTAIGGCSWWGGPQLLPLLVGMRRAEEILYLSARIDAEDAARMGLINRVVPVGQLAQATDDHCQKVLDLSEEGIRMTKAALRSTKEIMLASMTAAAEMNVAGLAKPHLHAAFDAFREGREMSWRALRPGLNER